MKLVRLAGRPQVHIVGLFVSLMAMLVVAAFAIGTLEYTKTRGKLLLTGFLVGGFFLTMLAATRIPAVDLAKWVRWSAQAMATGALFLLLLGLWGTPDSDAFWKSAAIATILAFGLALTGIAGMYSHRGRALGALAKSAVALSALLTAMSALGVALEIRLAVYWWAFALLVSCWLATGVGGLVVLLIPRSKYWRSGSPPAGPDVSLPVDPGCRK